MTGKDRSAAVGGSPRINHRWMNGDRDEPGAPAIYDARALFYVAADPAFFLVSPTENEQQEPLEQSKTGSTR